MGRIGSASNFVDALNGKAEALNTPEQALILMKIIDAMYDSASSKKPIAIV
jgi:predicted dehydrogenase